MQIQLEIQGEGFAYNIKTDSLADVLSFLRVAHLRGAADAPAMAIYEMPAQELEPEPPPPALEPPAKAPARSKPKQAKPAEASAPPPPPEVPPAPPQPVLAAPGAANGAPVDGESLRRLATAATIDALSRNRPAVQKLLGEFGVERFRDLPDDNAIIQKFHERVVSV